MSTAEADKDSKGGTKGRDKDKDKVVKESEKEENGTSKSPSALDVPVMPSPQESKSYVVWWNVREARVRVSTDAPELVRVLRECVSGVRALVTLAASDAAALAAAGMPSATLLASVSSPLALPLELLYAILPRGELSAELKLAALEVLRALSTLLVTHWAHFPRGHRSAYCSRLLGAQHAYYTKHSKEEASADFRKRALGGALYERLDKAVKAEKGALTAPTLLVAVASAFAEDGGVARLADDVEATGHAILDWAQELYPAKDKDEKKILGKDQDKETEKEVKEKEKDCEDAESDAERRMRKLGNKARSADKDTADEPTTADTRARERALQEHVHALSASARVLAHAVLPIVTHSLTESVWQAACARVAESVRAVLRVLLVELRHVDTELRVLADELRSSLVRILVKTQGLPEAALAMARFELSCAEQMLREEALQRRLRALQLLKGVVAMVDAPESAPSSSGGGAAKFVLGLFNAAQGDKEKDKPSGAEPELRGVSAAVLADEVRARGLLQRVEGLLPSHVEVFAQAVPLLSFCAEHGADDVVRVVAALGALRSVLHAHDVRVFDAALARLLPALPAAALTTLLAHWEHAHAAHTLDDAALAHVREIALRVDDATCARALELLWSACDASEFPSAPEHLAHVLSQPRAASLRERFLERCARALASDAAVQVLQRVWEAYGVGKARAAAIKEVLKLASPPGLVAALLAPLTAPAAAPPSPSALAERLRLLAYAAQHGPASSAAARLVDEQAVAQMWALLTAPHLATPALQETLCSWLGDALGQTLDEDAARALFERLCDAVTAARAAIPSAVVSLFVRVFAFVNVRAEKLVVVAGEPVVTDAAQLGIDALWSLALRLEEPAVALLCSAHARLERVPSLARAPSKALKLRDAVIARIVSLLRDDTNAGAALKVLERYVAEDSAARAVADVNEASAPAPQGSDATLKVYIKYAKEPTRSGVFKSSTRVGEVLERARVAFRLEGVPLRLSYGGKDLLDTRTLDHYKVADEGQLVLRKVEETRPLAHTLLSAALPELLATLGVSARIRQAFDLALDTRRDALASSAAKAVAAPSTPAGAVADVEDSTLAAGALVALSARAPEVLEALRDGGGAAGHVDAVWAALQRAPVSTAVVGEVRASATHAAALWSARDLASDARLLALAYRLRAYAALLAAPSAAPSPRTSLAALTPLLTSLAPMRSFGARAAHLELLHVLRALAHALQDDARTAPAPQDRSDDAPLSAETRDALISALAKTAAAHAPHEDAASEKALSAADRDAEADDAAACAALQVLAALLAHDAEGTSSHQILPRLPRLLTTFPLARTSLLQVAGGGDLSAWLVCTLFARMARVRALTATALTALLPMAPVSNALLGLLKKAAQLRAHSESYLALLERVLQLPSAAAEAASEVRVVDEAALFDELVQLVQALPAETARDESEPDEDEGATLVASALGLLATLLQRHAALATRSSALTLRTTLCCTLLFHARHPKLTRPASQRAAYRLLLALAAASPLHARALLHLVRVQLERARMVRGVAVKSAATRGDTGLVNLGNTCYMNAALQLLYRVPPLRASLLTATLRPEHALLRELQLLFARMQEGAARFVDTRRFARRVRIGGARVDVHVQMDASEFLTALLDELEQGLSAARLRALFGVMFAHELRGAGSGCSHVKERLEPGYQVEVEVKHHATLSEALHASVQGELLAGDNKYQCEACGRAVETVKRTCIHTLPPLLFVHLKRFEVDYASMTLRKLTSACAFPLTLDMAPFLATSAPPQPTQYTLHGVCLHAGTLDTGHYTAIVRSVDHTAHAAPAWLECNDTRVSRYEVQRLGEDAFGGEVAVRVRDKDGAVRWETRPKSQSAYLLLYARADVPLDALAHTMLAEAAQKSAHALQERERKRAALRRSRSHDEVTRAHAESKGRVPTSASAHDLNTVAEEDAEKGHERAKEKRRERRRNSAAHAEKPRRDKRAKSSDREAAPKKELERGKGSDKARAKERDVEKDKEKEKDKGPDQDRVKDKDKGKDKEKDKDKRDKETAKEAEKKDKERNSSESDSEDEERPDPDALIFSWGFNGDALDAAPTRPSDTRKRGEKEKRHKEARGARKEGEEGQVAAELADPEALASAYLAMLQSDEVQHSTAPTTSWAAISAQVLQRVQATNTALVVAQQLFSAAYTRFVAQLLTLPLPPPTALYDPALHRAQMRVYVLLRLLFRHPDTRALALFTAHACRALRDSRSAAMWLLRVLLLDDRAPLRFLAQLPSGAQRAAFAALVAEALAVVAPGERALYVATAARVHEDAPLTAAELGRSVSAAAALAHTLLALSMRKSTRDALKLQSLSPVVAFVRLGAEERAFVLRAFGDGGAGPVALAAVFEKALRKAGFFGQDKLSGYYTMSNKHVTHRIAPLLDLLVEFATHQRPPMIAHEPKDKDKEKDKEREKDKQKEKGSKDGDESGSLPEADASVPAQDECALPERSADDETFLYRDPRVVMKALRREANVKAIIRLCVFECGAQQGVALARNRALMWLALLKDGFADCVGSESVVPFTQVLIALIELYATPSERAWLWSELASWLPRVLHLLQRSKSAAERFLQLLEGAAKREESVLRELLKLRKELSEPLKLLELRFLENV